MTGRGDRRVPSSPSGTSPPANRTEDELRAAYEEIWATEEELREQYDKLSQNEQVLKDSEEKYRTLVENNQDIIYIYRGDHILVMNRRGPEVTGYTEKNSCR